MVSIVTTAKFAVVILFISRFVLNHQSQLVDASLAASKEYMSGKVLRVAVFHVIIFCYHFIICSRHYRKIESQSMLHLTSHSIPQR